MALQLQSAAPVSSTRRLSPPSPSTLSFPHQIVDSTCRSNFACLSCRGAEPRWRRSSVRVPAGASGGRRESPYEVLGVPPSAAPNEIKRAYRRLALRYHLDVNKEVRAVAVAWLQFSTRFLGTSVCNETLLIVEFVDFVNAGQCPGEVPANQARVQHSDELRKPIQVREQQFRLVLGLQVQGEQVNRGRRAVLWVWYRNPLLFCYPEMCS
jgi:hypothetical protein